MVSNPETWIAVASAITAVCALGVTVWQGRQNYKHNKMSVRPKLTAFENYDYNGKTRLVAFELINSGFGPAIIKDFILVYDGQEVSKNNRKTYEDFLREKTKSFTDLNIVSFVPDSSLLMNERCEIFSFRHKPGQDASFIDKLNLRVNYQSIEDEEDLGAREKTKGEWSRLEKLVGAGPRIKQVAEDIVNHYEARNSIIEGKAMIVAMSREICVHLYNEIIALKPEWHDTDPEKGAIKIIMTGSASDRELLRPHIYNKQTKKRLETRFKDVNDSLRIVIVRDMWLTGFDAPCCHTMYVDKPMKGHNLMQAIARVNRVFKNKPGGLVVDYIGIANELKQALKIYTDAKGKGEPALRAEEAFSVLLEKMDAVRGMFAKTNVSSGFDYSGYETQAHKILVPATNYILGLTDGKKRFLDLVLAITKAYSLCSTLDEAKDLRKEIAFFSAIKAAISKFTTVDRKLSQEDRNSALKQILDNAVIAEGVTDVFALCGLDKPNIGLLSDEFLEDVRQMAQRNLAIELLEKLLSDSIKSKTRNNVLQEKKYAERLQETLRKYNNRAIETAQVIEELIQMAKDFQRDLEREQNLGLNPDEVAFYDALANNASAVRELGDDTLKKIAIEITEKLRKSTTVDWQVRDSVRAQLRILVRRTLQRYKYPPDQAAEAVELVLKQAEALSNVWSSQ